MKSSSSSPKIKPPNDRKIPQLPTEVIRHIITLRLAADMADFEFDCECDHILDRPENYNMSAIALARASPLLSHIVYDIAVRYLEAAKKRHQEIAMQLKEHKQACPPKRVSAFLPGWKLEYPDEKADELEESLRLADSVKAGLSVALQQLEKHRGILT